jgi:hypothetical protein
MPVARTGFPIGQKVLNRQLEATNCTSNRTLLQDLVDIYFHTYRWRKAFKKKKHFKKVAKRLYTVDCVESNLNFFERFYTGVSQLSFENLFLF